MNQAPISLLILDDEWGVQMMFKAVLERAGYAVSTAANAFGAAALLEVQQFNLALIDLKLPGPSGLDLLQRLREWQTDCATVLISANPTREDILEALRAGVDDFLIKPISNEQLRRAVGEALLKHQIRRPSTSHEMVVGALRIDASHRTIYWHEQALTLTSTEYSLLRTLAQHAGRIVPASVLIRHCRGYTISEDEARQLIKPHIANLRQKLEQGSRFQRVLLNHRGLGFILSTDPSAEAVCGEDEAVDRV
ncbi:MAG: response regulator transcription factor [Aggregatilineales bacterium]